jgi:hypothetical protein
MILKLCPDCGSEKPQAEFHRNARTPDGLALYCKPCMNARTRASHARRAAAEGRLVRPRPVAPAGEKWCSGCESFQAQTAFGPNRANGDGLATYCRPCFRKKSNEHYRRRRLSEGFVVRDLSATPPGHKWCNKCRSYKEVDAFPPSNRSTDGRKSECRDCLSARQRRRHLEKKYGMSLERFDALMTTQGGRCAICGRELADKPHVDHDHVTGRVRALLCFNCNGGLGQFGDDPLRVERAALYLERYVPDRALEATFKRVLLDHGHRATAVYCPRRGQPALEYAARHAHSA